jgi:hypothetical protein
MGTIWYLLFVLQVPSKDYFLLEAFLQGWLDVLPPQPPLTVLTSTQLLVHKGL